MLKWSCWGSWFQGNYSVCKVKAVYFLFFEAKGSLRPVMLSCLLRSLMPVRFLIRVMARITLFRCFEKKFSKNLKPNPIWQFSRTYWNTGLVSYTLSWIPVGLDMGIMSVRLHVIWAVHQLTLFWRFKVSVRSCRFLQSQNLFSVCIQFFKKILYFNEIL